MCKYIGITDNKMTKSITITKSILIQIKNNINNNHNGKNNNNNQKITTIALSVKIMITTI